MRLIALTSHRADEWNGGDGAITAGLRVLIPELSHTAIEFAAEELTDGMDWLTLEVGAEATVLNLSVVAVLSRLRYGHGVSALA